MSELQNGHIDSLIDVENVGLLVVDVQTKLWPFIHDREEVLRRLLQAIEVAGHLELPILVTEQYVKGLGPTLHEVRQALDMFDAYNPIEKVSFSCLGEPRFVAKLEASGIETLIVVGIEAHVCVLQTVIGALDRGLEVYVISEATGARNEHNKEVAIWRMREVGAVVGSVEMFAFEAMRTAKHPAFRKVQKVIL